MTAPGEEDAVYCRGDLGPGVLPGEFLRVPYDVEAAVRAVEASPLPDAFAALLRLLGSPPPLALRGSAAAVAGA